MAEADPTSRGALFERIVETTSEGVWVIDSQSITTYVNQAMADMLGYGREELTGHSMFELMDEADQHAAAVKVDRRRAGIAEVHEFAFRRKDGSRFCGRLTTTPLVAADGGYAGAFALVADLTETHLEDERRQRLWQILDESLNEVYLFRRDDLGFEYASGGALRNLGLSLAELRALSPVDIKPGHTMASFRRLVEPLEDRREAKLVFQTVHWRRDGSTYPVEVHLQRAPGDDRLFLAIINDITARQEAERQRSASEARFRALIELSLDLLILSRPDGRFTFVSPSVTRILGYAVEEFLALEPLEVIHPDDRPVAAAAFAESAPERIDFRVRHRDGSWRTLSSSGRNLVEDPNVNGFVLNSRDVTGERELEAQLQQSQRLESVGRLAGGVAHDFNNILTTILGSAAFIRESGALSPSVLEDVREIERAGERASELTNQLLSFARRRVIRPQRIELGRVIANQERFLRRVIGEQIALTTHVSPDLWPIHVDPAQLEQVVVNLAVNARDAMKESGGRLTLEAHNVVLDDTFVSRHAEVKPGPYVRLMVSDDGEGIPADVLPYIFEPFFTTKDVGAGSGLGLATVYGIVRQSDGYIWVYSEPGIGTTFKIYFPRSAAVDGAAAGTSVHLSRGGSERVLVVEDEDAVRRTLVRALETAGYAVYAAPTPAAGLAWARAHRGAFDLLITDVVMPGMSGKQLAAELTGEFPHVRVLYISGYTENTIVHRGVLEEGVQFLAKPFTLLELRSRVREVLDQS